MPGATGPRSKSTLRDAILDEARQVERRQTVALLVLGDLCIGVGEYIAHDNGHFRQAGSLSRAPALGAEVDAIATGRVGGMHDDRLQDAVLADVLGEFVELNFGELGARVGRVLLECRDRQDQELSVSGSRDNFAWQR